MAPASWFLGPSGPSTALAQWLVALGVLVGFAAAAVAAAGLPTSLRAIVDTARPWLPGVAAVVAAAAGAVAAWAASEPNQPWVCLRSAVFAAASTRTGTVWPEASVAIFSPSAAWVGGASTVAGRAASTTPAERASVARA